MIALLIVFLIGTSFSSGIKAQQLPGSSGPLSIPKDDNNRAALPPGFQIVASTPTSIVLDIHAPSYNLERVISKGKSCQNLKADGYYQTPPPGEPSLLSAGVMLGIPIGTTPTLTIKSIETLDIPGDIHLCPVVTPIIQSDPIGLTEYRGEVVKENTLTYSRDVFIPSQPVAIEVRGLIRSQQVARVNYTPFIYNPVRDELKIIHRITIVIDLGDYDATSVINDLVDEGSFESLLQKILINYNQARNWRIPHQQANSVVLKPTVSNSTDQSVFKIQVDQDGLYQVTYNALQSAGVPVDNLDPRTFKLLNQGIEIPLYIFGEEDGVFNLEDQIFFYGQKINTKFTNTNIYWLSWGIANGLRMLTRDGSIHDATSPVTFFTTIHLEENHSYFRNSPSGSQFDHWYWSLLNANGAPVSIDFTFLLQNLSMSPVSAKVRGLLKGYYADPQHHTRIYLNGHLIDDHTWPSTSEYSFSIDIDQSFLVEGSNTLTVECPLDGGITVDQLLVNWFDIDYYHTFTSDNGSLVFDGNLPGVWEFHVGGFSSDAIDVFDITNPSIPVRIVGGSIIPNGPLFQVNFEQQISGDYRYLTASPSSWLAPTAINEDDPSNLKDSSNGADYIIISPADFLNAISPLATYRSNQGLRVKVVDVQDIYDEFNGGIFDPHSIQSFLAYTYSHWIAPAPSYVLLVGDGHYDFKNYYGDSGSNYIPPYLGEYDPWIGETGSDNRFVTVSGDDILADMYIGRLPANSETETTAMVNKTLFYEQNPAQGDWDTQLTFVADNADAGGNFPALSDNIIDQFLPPDYLVEKIYFGIPPYISVDETRAAILSAVNQGRLILSFVGHGSVQFWASENLLSVNNIDSLTNIGKYPFFAPMTCAEGYFLFPKANGFDYPSLAESLVRVADKGAIASFSPAGFGLASGHDILAEGLYQGFFSYGMIQFGIATTFAKYYLDANGAGFKDLIDTYNLLGDPAAKLKIPPTAILVSFNGKILPEAIQLNWETSNELWLVGFNLYRSNTQNGERQKVNSDLIIAKKPGQVDGATYDYYDGIDPGKNYFYWLELVQVYGRDLVGPIPFISSYSIKMPLITR